MRAGVVIFSMSVVEAVQMIVSHELRRTHKNINDFTTLWSLGLGG